MQTYKSSRNLSLYWAFLACAFASLLGAHRFYLGQNKTGAAFFLFGVLIILTAALAPDYHKILISTWGVIWVYELLTLRDKVRRINENGFNE